MRCRSLVVVAAIFCASVLADQKATEAWVEQEVSAKLAAEPTDEEETECTSQNAISDDCVPVGCSPLEVLKTSRHEVFSCHLSIYSCTEPYCLIVSRLPTLIQWLFLTPTRICADFVWVCRPCPITSNTSTTSSTVVTISMTTTA